MNRLSPDANVGFEVVSLEACSTLPWIASHLAGMVTAVVVDDAEVGIAGLPEHLPRTQLKEFSVSDCFKGNILGAVDDLNGAKTRSRGEFNCASFAFGLVGAPLEELCDSLPDGWDFEARLINDMPPESIVRLVDDDRSPSCAVGDAHWYTVLSKSGESALHVDGWRGPLRLSKFSDLTRSYSSRGVEPENYQALFTG